MYIYNYIDIEITFIRQNGGRGSLVSVTKFILFSFTVSSSVIIWEEKYYIVIITFLYYILYNVIIKIYISLYYITCQILRPGVLLLLTEMHHSPPGRNIVFTTIWYIIICYIIYNYKIYNIKIYKRVVACVWALQSTVSRTPGRRQPRDSWWRSTTQSSCCQRSSWSPSSDICSK